MAFQIYHSYNIKDKDNNYFVDYIDNVKYQIYTL
ncbi:MAG: hypothetical protein RLZZ04_1470 [Cyanobacteriota bacterium]|jgi:hypothetical protein